MTTCLSSDSPNFGGFFLEWSSDRTRAGFPYLGSALRLNRLILAVFVLTQMHGLGLRKSTHWWIATVFTASVIAVYSWRGFDRVDEVVRIPMIEYLLVGIVVALIWLAVRIAKPLRRKPTEEPVPPDRERVP